MHIPMWAAFALCFLWFYHQGSISVPPYTTNNWQLHFLTASISEQLPCQNASLGGVEGMIEHVDINLCAGSIKGVMR